MWHNTVLCCACLVLMWLLPVLLWPMYSSNGDGVTVMWVHDQSPVFGSITVGSLVQRVDDCDVHDTREWQRCMELRCSRCCEMCVCVWRC